MPNYNSVVLVLLFIAGALVVVVAVGEEAADVYLLRVQGYNSCEGVVNISGYKLNF